jgi:hypothetical protein
MPPMETRCPHCERKLNVPENLNGKKVRCPGCKDAFVVDLDGDEAPAEAAVTTKPRRPTPPPPAEVDDDRPRRRRREDDEDDYDEPRAEDESGDEEEDDEDRPRRRKRKRSRGRQAAASAVMGPAIALMIVGGLTLVVYVVDIILRLAGVAMFGAAGGAPQGDAANAMGFMVGSIVGAIVALCWGGIVLSGAVQMLRLRGYGYAMTATIVAMVPCSACCILGLPFGIWGLVVLMKPEVKDAFR